MKSNSHNRLDQHLSEVDEVYINKLSIKAPTSQLKKKKPIKSVPDVENRPKLDPKLDPTVCPQITVDIVSELVTSPQHQPSPIAIPKRQQHSTSQQTRLERSATLKTKKNYQTTRSASSTTGKISQPDLVWHISVPSEILRWRSTSTHKEKISWAIISFCWFRP